MAKLFDFPFFLNAFPKLLHELPMTLFVASVSCVCGLLIGTLVTFVHVRRIPVLSQLSRVYISLIRGTPAVVQIFLCFFLLPAVFQLFGVKTKEVPLVLYALVACSLHLGGGSQRNLEVYLAVGILYIALCLLLHLLFSVLEERIRVRKYGQ